MFSGEKLKFRHQLRNRCVARLHQCVLQKDKNNNNLYYDEEALAYYYDAVQSLNR